jgi:hypothetical protein
MIGNFHNCDSVRATTATETSGAPIPGPEMSQDKGDFMDFLFQQLPYQFKIISYLWYKQ